MYFALPLMNIFFWWFWLGVSTLHDRRIEHYS